MAKANGNRLTPRANYTRNPMQNMGGPSPRATYRGSPLGPNPMGQQVREMLDRDGGISPGGKPNGMVDRGIPPVRVRPGFLEQNYYMGTPNSPQNQDVLNRANAALEALKQDRLAPQYGGATGSWNPADGGGATGSWGPNSVPQIDIWNNGRQIASPQPGARVRSQRELEETYALTDKINALRDRSALQDNPMAPNSPLRRVDPGVAAMRQGIDQGTRQGNIMFEPGAGSSLGATRNFRKIQPEDLNGMTAGTVNGYNGNAEYARNPMRLDPETKFNLARGNARRIAGGGAAADPTNIGGRFGGAYGDNLNADATAIQEGLAVRTADGNVVYHTGSQESAQKAYMSARANGYGRTPEQEAARHAKAVEQAAARASKHDAFKDANGGMNYRQYDRMTGGSNGNNALTMKAVREGRLSPEEANYRMQIRAEKALRRSGNPITAGTSQAGQLYPDMMAGRGGKTATANQNPMARAFNSMTKDSAPSADSLEAATGLAVATVNGIKGPDGVVVRPPSAFAKQLKDRGYSPEDDPGMALPNTHVYETIQGGNKLNPSDVRDLRNIAFSSRERTKNDTEWWGGKKAPFSNIGAGPFQKNPEYQKEVQDMYNTLADMPEDAPDAQYEKWANDMQDLVKRWRL